MKKITLCIAMAIFTTMGYAQIQSEDFEGAMLPDGWTSTILGGTQDWTFGSGDMPTGTDFDTNAAIFDDDAAGGGSVGGAELISPAVDITSFGTITLSYDFALQDFAGDGLLRVEAWDGSAWQEIALYDDADFNPSTESLDVSAFSNDAFQVRFTYDDEGAFAWGAGVDNFLLEGVNCVAPVVDSAEVVEDCDNGQFSIDVDISDLGESTTLVISNDVDGNTIDVTETGVVTVGPFDDGASVTITLGAEDMECDVVLDTITFNCPPANDTCLDAIALTDGDSATVNTTFANQDVEAAGCSASTASLGVWYFVNGGDQEIEVTVDTFGSDFDTEISVYSGACGALSCVGNNDDSGGAQSSFTFTTDGNNTDYYVLATGFGSNTGNLVVNVAGAGLLSTEATEITNFSMFPNPALNELNIAAPQTIDSIKMFNIMGQEVMAKSINATSDRLDVSGLTSGIYLVQVVAEGKTGTYKFIKR